MLAPLRLPEPPGPSGDAAGSGYHSRRRPGQPGTKALLEEYGDRLVCVRYYYDPVKERRLKTVELIVNEAERSSGSAPKDPRRLVGVRVGIDEVALRAGVKAASGKWEPGAKLWLMPWQCAANLGLGDRVVELQGGLRARSHSNLQHKREGP